MKITLLVTSFFSLAGLSKAFQTIRPGQKKDVVVPKKETAPDEPSPFTPWPASRVIAHGDYRDESWLDEHIGGPLYSQQKDLPLLPVPSLEETMETFALSALPMARSKAEEENVKDACNKFIEQAQLLQKRLLALRDACQDTSWLQKFWNTQGYLQYRDPVAVKVSYFLYVPDDRTLPDVSHKGVARGAALLAALAQGRKAICSGSMAAESMRNEPICSNGFKYLWHSCRVPQPQQDTYHLYDPSRYNHCVVACKGQFFKVDFVDAQGDPLPVRVLEQSLQQCVEQAAAQENKHHPQLGWLTSLPRDAWAQARHELLDVGGKPVQEALEMLESGAFVLTLDEDVCTV